MENSLISPNLQEDDTEFLMVGLFKQHVSTCNASLKIFPPITVIITLHYNHRLCFKLLFILNSDVMESLQLLISPTNFALQMKGTISIMTTETITWRDSQKPVLINP